MDKYVSLSSYKGGRSCLITVIILSTINLFLGLSESNFSFLYSIFLPQLAISVGKYNFTGIESALVIVLFAIIPIILLGICYLLSKKDWKWLLVANVIVGIDILILLAYSLLVYFDVSFLINYTFEGIIFFLLIKSVRAGKELNNDFEVPNQDEVISEAVDNQEESSSEKIKVYTYDKQLAKQNKADKTVLYFMSLVAFFFMEILIATALVIFADESTILTVVLLILAILLVGVFIVLSIKISPFVCNNSYSYYKKDDCVCRISSASLITTQIFANLLVEKQTDSAYYCSYISQNGKRRRLIIPKCYPQIDEILL